jgi:hypothetical protein
MFSGLHISIRRRTCLQLRGKILNEILINNVKFRFLKDYISYFNNSNKNKCVLKFNLKSERKRPLWRLWRRPKIALEVTNCQGSRT